MKIQSYLQRLRLFISQLVTFPQRLDDLQMALGRIEMRQLAEASSMSTLFNEFKVYSQNGEDGIIQFLIRNIEIPNKTFVEFGVHNYTESNTRFLLKNNGWSGLVIDGSNENINYIKSDQIYWQHNLKAECAFIDKDNINDLIKTNGLSGDIGLLSVDIDGNDYWVWEAINCISPRIVICEYNSIFGAYKKVTIPYDKYFVYSKAHFSTLYWGASIAAFNYLAQQKGYSLVCSNNMGNNLFFVRNDLMGNLPINSPEKAYVKSQFRTSRDIDGRLTFLDFDSGLKLIADMPLYEVDTGKVINVRAITDES
jgi:hypothetical protein